MINLYRIIYSNIQFQNHNKNTSGISTNSQDNYSTDAENFEDEYSTNSITDPKIKYSIEEKISLNIISNILKSLGDKDFPSYYTGHYIDDKGRLHMCIHDLDEEKINEI